MYKRAACLFCLLLIHAYAVLPAAESTTDLPVGADGVFEIDCVSVEVIHFAPGWALTTQKKNLTDIKRKTENGAQRIEGRFETASGALRFVQSMTEQKETGGCEVRYALSSPTPVATLLTAVNFTLPVATYGGGVLQVDGKEYTLPAVLGEQNLPVPGEAATVVIATPKGKLTIRGPFHITLQDDRKFGVDTYSLRIFLHGVDAEKLVNAQATVQLSFEPYKVVPLNLRESANMGFRDETADDRRGGWTDQGDNDLRAMIPGLRTLGNVPFDIIDPESNGGKSCMAFVGPQREYFLKQAVLQVPATASGMRYLYLLHAGAWMPAKGEIVGDVVASYADGTNSRHQLKSREDLGDWWTANNLERASIAWKGENPRAVVGLYRTLIKLENKPLNSIRFLPSAKAVWMVVGASLSDAEIPAQRELPLVLAAGKQWKPLPPDEDILPGSVMDFSFLNESGPAGKHGRIVIRDGHFEYDQQPGKRVRLLGSNLCFSANFLEHAQADRLAQQWRMTGYNSVRIHHYDGMLTGDKENGPSDQMVESMLDKLDYLFAAMKKQGMYVTIDLYTIRTFAPKEIAGWDKPAHFEIKALVPLLPGAFDAWSKMALQLLNHVNPYTGIAWKDDPALFSICPLNEDPIYTVWGEYPEVKKLYLQKFEVWLKNRNLTPVNGDQRESLLTQYLLELEVASNQKLGDFLRANGVKALLTGSNFFNRISQTFTRSELDVVDNHDYWDHPQFPGKMWQLPWANHQRSVIRHAAETPRNIMATRVFGKPFIVTEFNYTPPNSYRAEGGAVMGAYAALQNWDALYRFAWSHTRQSIIQQQALGGFDSATDPISRLTERQIALLFLRGDLAPATQKFVYAVTLPEAVAGGSTWGGAFPEKFQKVGLVAQIGSQVVDEKRSIIGTFTGVSAERKPGETALAGNSYVSVDALPAGGEKNIYTPVGNQIQLAQDAGTFSVNTPNTACLILPEGVAGSSGGLSVRDNDAFCSISVSSLDSKPIKQSKHLLMLHITDALNTNMRFASESKNILERWGNLPLLARSGKARVAIHIASGLKVWAVTLSGKRVFEVKSSYENDMLSFTAQTTPEGYDPVMIYEISE